MANLRLSLTFILTAAMFIIGGTGCDFSSSVNASAPNATITISTLSSPSPSPSVLPSSGVGLITVNLPYSTNNINYNYFSTTDALPASTNSLVLTNVGTGPAKLGLISANSILSTNWYCTNGAPSGLSGSCMTALQLAPGDSCNITISFQGPTCGSTSVIIPYFDGVQDRLVTNQNGGSFEFLSNVGSILNAGTGNGSSSSIASNILPASITSFEVIGGANAGVTVASGIQTDDHLRVRVTVGAAGTTVVPSGSSTNQSSGYRCAKYAVTVGGVTQTTDVLALVAGDPLCSQLMATQGSTASNSQILNFPQSSGHGLLTVQVNQVRTSVYCEMLMSGSMGMSPGSTQYNQWLPTYCSSGLYTPYSYTCTSGSNGSAYPGQPNLCGHVTTGTLEIETNGTQLQ